MGHQETYLPDKKKLSRETRERERERDMGLRTCFISIIFFSSFVNSQEDNCTSNINLKGVLPFDTTALHCHHVWPAQDFILRYLQTGPSLWTFVLSTPTANSYVAMGFSGDGKMVGSSAMVGWISGAGKGVLKQYYLEGARLDQVTPDQGSLRVVNSSMLIVSNSTRLYITFQLNTLQPESRLIYAVGQTNRTPTDNNILAQHKDQASTILNYASGQIITERPYTRLRRAHGMLNMLGWGIITFIGAMAARYLKDWEPIWFYSHTTIQTIGFVLGASGVFAGFALEDFLNITVDRHKTLGIAVLILACLQVVAFLVRPYKESKVRKYWNWYHGNVGRVLIILAVANIFYGIHVGREHNGWNVGYGVTLTFLIVVAISLEVKMWMRK